MVKYPCYREECHSENQRVNRCESHIRNNSIEIADIKLSFDYQSAIWLVKFCVLLGSVENFSVI